MTGRDKKSAACWPGSYTALEISDSNSSSDTPACAGEKRIPELRNGVTLSYSDDGSSDSCYKCKNCDGVKTNSPTPVRPKDSEEEETDGDSRECYGKN